MNSSKSHPWIDLIVVLFATLAMTVWAYKVASFFTNNSSICLIATTVFILLIFLVARFFLIPKNPFIPVSLSLFLWLGYLLLVELDGFIISRIPNIWGSLFRIAVFIIWLCVLYIIYRISAFNPYVRENKLNRKIVLCCSFAQIITVSIFLGHLKQGL